MIEFALQFLMIFATLALVIVLAGWLTYRLYDDGPQEQAREDRPPP